MTGERTTALRVDLGRQLRLTCLSLVFLSLVACAGGGKRGVAPVCPEPGKHSTDYIIGAGDSLQIFVWRNADLTTTVPVRPDGKISIPLVEDMQAVGKTPTELARDIEAVFAEYLRTPTVNIIVASQGAANQIQVVGNVANPQSLPYRTGIKLLDVVVAVGGLDDFAAGNRAKIIRQIEGNSVECPVRVADLMRKGDLTQNIRIYPGDVLIVPAARF
ncbi:MAG: polysaccharide export protein [Gammaproteobacteria bacterium]|nr:polysaccharide export protein [Gammaproteobacteria bacterium]